MEEGNSGGSGSVWGRPGLYTGADIDISERS